MNVLEQLFEGAINPKERFVKKGSEYDKVGHRAADLSEKLRSSLNQDERLLFEAVERATADLWMIEGKEWFTEGFCIGLQMAWEVLHYQSPNFKD